MGCQRDSERSVGAKGEVVLTFDQAAILFLAFVAVFRARRMAKTDRRVRLILSYLANEELVEESDATQSGL